jgi:hypothetical protein
MNTTVLTVRAEPSPAVRMVIDASNAIDQSAEQRFRAEAIRRLVSKLDRRLIPFLFILEMSSYLNRNSIGMHF